jgi:ferredoxin
MSVFVTFQEDGGNGLVACGASLWDAAKRLGVGLSADCKGAGECDGCVLQIVRGPDSLSPATAAELKILGAERLLAGERLACQTVLVKNGEVGLKIIPPTITDQRANKTLPFKQQVGTFIESEAKAMSEAVNMIRGKTHELVGKFLNLEQEKPSSTSQKRDKPPAK